MGLFTRNSFIGLRLLLLAVLSFVLMTVDHRMESAIKVRAVLTLLVSPLIYLVDSPIKLVDAVKSNIVTQQKLIIENAQLRADQFLLEAKLQKLMALEKENAQLKQLLSSSNQLETNKYLMARIIAVDLPGYIDQVMLNKGVNDGVYVGQPVLDAYGVFGQVIAVDKFNSRVLLITDPRSGVPVKNNRNGTRGIVVGAQYRGLLSLLHVTNTTDIAVGDLVVTSGLGMVYPEGYPVGIVKSIEHKPGEQFATIDVEPSAHVNRSQQVLLIWPK